MDLLYSPVHRSHSMVTLKSSKKQESDHIDPKLLLEKYNRLLESHHRLLRVNQNLEDKLLRVVTICEEQKDAMKSEMDTMQEQLTFFKSRTERLEQENIKYREDCSLAIQLLQCNPTNFVDQNFQNLPGRVQIKVNSLSLPLAQNGTDGDHSDSDENPDSSGIQIFPCFFPPSAVMVPKPSRRRKGQYAAVNGHQHRPQNLPDQVSAEFLANIIDDDLKEMSSPPAARRDIRARPSSSFQVKANGAVGKIFDV